MKENCIQCNGTGVKASGALVTGKSDLRKGYVEIACTCCKGTGQVCSTCHGLKTSCPECKIETL